MRKLTVKFGGGSLSVEAIGGTHTTATSGQARRVGWAKKQTEVPEAPTVSDVTISGTPGDGQVLTGNYSFGGGVITSGPRFAWLLSSDNWATPGTQIGNASSLAINAAAMGIGYQDQIGFRVEGSNASGTASDTARVTYLGGSPGVPNLQGNNPPASGTVGQSISYAPVNFGGGVDPIEWSATGLPAGISVDSQTGEISGTPSGAGASAITVRATDDNGAFDEITWTLTIAAAQTLAALTGTFTLREDALAGAVAGTISGITNGATLSLVDSAGGRVELSGSQIRLGATALDYEAATSHSFTVRATLAGATNSPLDTVLTLNVTDVAEGGGGGGDSGTVATISPAAAWGTGGRTAGAGWGGAVPRPVPSMTSKADIRALTDPARPPLQKFFRDRVAFSGTRRVYAFAGAIDTDGTLINTMGMSGITFLYEGTSVVVGAPGFHSYTDANGTSRTIFGWAIDLVHNGNGTAELFLKGTPRDGSKNVRIIGPYIFYPSAAANEGTLKIAATPPAQAGVQYKTIDEAAAYAQQQGWQTWTADVIETSIYSIHSSAALYSNAGRMIVKGSVPFTIGGTPPATNYTAQIGGTYTNSYKAGITATLPRFKRVEFQGANCTLDYRYMREFGSSTRSYDIFWNGNKVTDSSGRGGRWAMGPRPYSKLVDKASRLFAQDCPLINYVNDPFKEAVSVVNCTLRDLTGDIFTGTEFIYGNDVDVAGKDCHTYQPAFTIHYSGAGTPTVEWVSSTTSGSYRDFVLKVNGAQVGRYSIKSGENNFAANYNVGNYTIAHLVAYINSRSGWSATTLDNSTRAQYISRLALGQNGGVLGASPSNGAGKTFLAEPVGTSSGTATTFYTFQDMHADWMAMQGMNENQISWNNRSTNLRGCITYWLGNGTGARDYLFGNNIFHQPETNVAGTTKPFYVNPPLQQILVPAQNLAFVHNTYTDQNHTVKTTNGSGIYANNAFRSLQWQQANSMAFRDNHTVSSGTGLSGAINHTSGGAKASLWVAPDADDFTPAGLLASNTKARRVRYDINGNERAAMDAAGAVRKAA